MPQHYKITFPCGYTIEETARNAESVYPEEPDRCPLHDTKCKK